MLPIFTGMLLKLSVFYIWSLLVGLAFKRPVMSSSGIVLLIGSIIISLTFYAGFCGLEFFILLLLLIYVSAILILFLFAFMLLPLDTHTATSLEKHWGAESFEASARTLFEPYSIALFLLIGYCSERLWTARNYMVRSGFDNAASKSLSFNPFDINWLKVMNLHSSIQSLELALTSRTPTGLAISMHTQYFMTIFIIMLALLLVMVGTLVWLRSVKLKVA